MRLRPVAAIVHSFRDGMLSGTLCGMGECATTLRSRGLLEHRKIADLNGRPACKRTIDIRAIKDGRLHSWENGHGP